MAASRSDGLAMAESALGSMSTFENWCPTGAHWWPLVAVARVYRHQAGLVYCCAAATDGH